MNTIEQKDITLVYSFRNRIDTLIKSLASADRTSQKELSFCLVDAGSSTENIEKLRDFCNKNLRNRKVRICESAYRTNICQAWNLGIMLSDTRYVIFASSDVEFVTGGWAEELVNQFRLNNEYILIENHAVFGFDKLAALRMGLFDENFGSGPHFDCDFMIRATEARVNLRISHNNYYHHADTPEETKDRLTKDCSDRLPMNDFHNEDYFRRKWDSKWPGWRDAIGGGNYTNLPHPPTHVGQVVRLLPEKDWHPSYMVKIKELYGN